ncbi:PE family protein, partial [Mycobacterium gordonae]|uniref:PE family protein n=1 Tax=Mycobacterium gordonae TaxID=1778 RepID=UPI00210B923F
MSFVNVLPAVLADAATDLAGIGFAVNAANQAAAVHTAAVLAAAEDEVSVAVAGLFEAHCRAYQSVGAQAAAFQGRFLGLLASGAGDYAAAEAAAAQPLQSVIGVINGQFVALTGRPLIGNGTNGAPGTGQSGTPGGWLVGNGGAGGSGTSSTTDDGGTGGAGAVGGLFG